MGLAMGSAIGMYVGSSQNTNKKGHHSNNSKNMVGKAFKSLENFAENVADSFGM